MGEAEGGGGARVPAGDEVRVNPEWIRLVAELVDDAHDTIGRHFTSPMREASSLEASLLPNSRGAAVVAELRTSSSAAPLGELWLVAVMAANRFAVTGMAHIDGLRAVLTVLSAEDSHVAAAPAARAALEHLGAAGWILDPAIPPRTTIARYVALLKDSAAAAAGLHRGDEQKANWLQAFANKQVHVLHQAGGSTRQRDHSAAVQANGGYAAQIDRTLQLGALLGIEAAQDKTRAKDLYDLLNAWVHPSFVEQVAGDMYIAAAGGGTLHVPRSNLELSRLAVVSTTRLLRIVVELLLRVAGAADDWADRTAYQIRRM